MIGFQEVQEPNLTTYQDRLDGYDHVPGNLYGDAEPTERTAIFWRTARLELLAAGEFWHSRTPDQPSTDWEVPYPMGATWGKLRCRDSGTPLLHLNSHLDDDSPLSRLAATKLICTRVARLQDGGQPAIVTGDFNGSPWHPPSRVFVDHNVVDVYRAAGHADSAAARMLHGLRGDAYFALEWGREVFWRVDWILTHPGAKGIQVTSCTIVRDAQPPLYPSDHYPVVAELRLPSARNDVAADPEAIVSSCPYHTMR